MEEELQAIANMLKQAREHNLEVECVFTMAQYLVRNIDVKQACASALCEWDI